MSVRGGDELTLKKKEKELPAYVSAPQHPKEKCRRIDTNKKEQKNKKMKNSVEEESKNH